MQKVLSSLILLAILVAAAYGHEHPAAKTQKYVRISQRNACMHIPYLYHSGMLLPTVRGGIWGRGSEKGPSGYYKNLQEGASKFTRAIKMYA